MAISSGQRRQLAAKGNRLKANVIISAGDLSDAAVEHVRNAFGDKELIKVRINTDDRQECARTADALAVRIPCELVQRVGRVALLYHKPEDDDPAGDNVAG